MVDLGSPVIGAAAVLVLLAASAFFSATEIAVFSLPASWFSAPGSEADRRRRTLSRLRSNPHRLLVTLLVGNNVVNVALSVVITVSVATAFPPPVAVLVSTLLASVVVLVFGEILPKSYGLGHAESWARSAAGPLAAIQVGLYPVVATFDVLTRWLSRPLGGDQEIEQPYAD